MPPPRTTGSPPRRVVVEQWLGAPCLSYPDRPPTVVHVLEHAVRSYGDRTFLIDPASGRQVTYAEFADLVEGAVDVLHRLGVRPGDPIATVAGNSLGLVVALYACARGRFVLAGVNVRLAPPQWEHIVEQAGAGVVLVGGPYADVARERFPLAVDIDGLLVPEPWRGLSGRPLPAEEDTYQLVHTSGTTGHPKGSQVVHRASVHSALSYVDLLELTGADVTAVLFGAYYISAQHAHLLPAMLVGARAVLVDTGDPREFLGLLIEHEVSWAYAVPSVWQLLTRDQRLHRDRLPSLRLLGMGGSPWPPELGPALRDRLPDTALLDVYGLSETHSPACALRNYERSAHPGSVGRPLPCMEARLVDDELQLRGALVTTGYWRDPVATDAAISDGWFATGDVASIDDDGYVTILDRRKDMINKGGQKLFSAELEAALRRHPAIDEAAVVGVPDRISGETVVAFVVGDLDAAGVRSWLSEEVAPYAAPRAVFPLAELPRNATGKTDKPLLRRWAADGGPPDAAAPGRAR